MSLSRCFTPLPRPLLCILEEPACWYSQKALAAWRVLAQAGLAAHPCNAVSLLIDKNLEHFALGLKPICSRPLAGNTVDSVGKPSVTLSSNALTRCSSRVTSNFTIAHDIRKTNRCLADHASRSSQARCRVDDSSSS